MSNDVDIVTSGGKLFYMSSDDAEGMNTRFDKSCLP